MNPVATRRFTRDGADRVDGPALANNAQVSAVDCLHLLRFVFKLLIHQVPGSICADGCMLQSYVCHSRHSLSSLIRG